MDETHANELEQLRSAIAMLEAQRPALGDALVDAALAPLRERMARLTAGGESAPVDQPTAPQPVEPQPELPPQTDPNEPVEQRRLVSVLFSDLVDFTPMAERHDPEDVREVLRAYFERWTACIHHYGGVVEKFIGDAVMAVFGLHSAREDDAERAVHAALEMKAALEDLNALIESQYGLRLQMRTAVHTGPVVASFRPGRRDQNFTVVGDTVNLASRLQTVAPPNEVIISHETFRLVRGAFFFQALEPVRVKGKRDAIRVYVVQRAKPRVLRFERTRAETPLVGREPEIQLLMELLRQAVATGSQRTILIEGEAGIGKSRLLEEMEYRFELLPDVLRYFKGRASPYLQQQPFALLRDLFSYRFNIQDGDEPLTAVEKLASGLGSDQSARIVARLLGFTVDEALQQAERTQPGAAPARRHTAPRQLFSEALVELATFFRRAAEAIPVVVALEDIQWADSSTVEMIAALRRELVDAPIFWVATTRPEGGDNFLPELRTPTSANLQDSGGPVRRIALKPLSGDEAQAMLENLLAQAHPDPENAGPVPEMLRDLAVRSAEGNPFYLEELLRMLIEDGLIAPAPHGWQASADRLAAAAIPPTLAEFLQARLDALPPDERALLQRAAVVGRIFWDQAVEYMHGDTGKLPGPANERSGSAAVFERLRENDVILLRTPSQFEGTREFAFRQNLLREATYQSLLRRQRRLYHAHAARWLEEVTGRASRSGEYAALIAEHYDLAEETAKAAEWYGRAGELASARYANAEAVHALSRALELLGEGPQADPARYHLLMEREKVYDRLINRQAQTADLDALETLARAIGDPEKQVEVALRRAALSFYLTQYDEAIAITRVALEQAERAGSARLIAECELEQGRALFWKSENQEAIPHLERAMHIAREAGAGVIEAFSVWNLGIIDSNTGEFQRSEQRLTQARELFVKLGDREGEALSVAQLGNTAFSQGDIETAQHNWEAAREIFHWTGQRLREATLANNLAAIATIQGEFEKALRLHHEALRIYREAGDRNGEAVSITNQGELLREEGLFEQAREMFYESLQITRALNDRYNIAIVLIDYSRLYQMTGKPDRARDTAEEGLRIAQETQAAYYETYGLFRLARAYLELGDLDQSERYFLEAEKLQGSIGLTVNALESRAMLGRIALARGDAALALREVEPLLSGLQELDISGADDPVEAYLTIIRVLRANGDPRADRILQAARSFVLGRAAKIPKESIRKAYLENVAANRELLAMSGDAGISG